MFNTINNLNSKKCNSKDRQKEFEDTKRVIRIRKSEKDRQHNGQKKKDKRTNNDLLKDWSQLLYELIQLFLLWYWKIYLLLSDYPFGIFKLF
jgi:hypothetical protein